MFGDRQGGRTGGWLQGGGSVALLFGAIYLTGKGWDWATGGLPDEARGSTIALWLALPFGAICVLHLLLSWIAVTTAGTRAFPTHGLQRVTDQPETLKPPARPRLVTIGACLYVAMMAFAAWPPLVALAQDQEWLKVAVGVGSRAIGLLVVVWVAFDLMRRYSPAALIPTRA